MIAWRGYFHCCCVEFFPKKTSMIREVSTVRIWTRVVMIFEIIYNTKELLREYWNLVLWCVVTCAIFRGSINVRVSMIVIAPVIMSSIIIFTYDSPICYLSVITLFISAMILPQMVLCESCKPPKKAMILSSSTWCI